ncbi:hypothetical protein [Vagococcus bubulae]|uniref:Uncharacterized protein n=1 Tax=Vagococcus bubulae TaxID=1977868 RepID=A0A429ZAA3_9ENTE|nr:hypothetical protein [Vagococcus bubulae]RST90647.1 hypothetical protein CBF36_11365 [Vagococcus bubulae]
MSTNTSKYIYQISTNPVLESNALFSFYEKEETTSFGFLNDFSIMTGMCSSLEQTIDTIKKSSLVFITGYMDHTSFFELGLAVSLDKQIYYVTEHLSNTFNLPFPYSIEQIIPISYDDFINIVDYL